MNQEQNSFQNYQTDNNNYQNQVVYEPNQNNYQNNYQNQNFYNQPNAYQEASFDEEPKKKSSKKLLWIIIGGIILIAIVIALILFLKNDNDTDTNTPNDSEKTVFEPNEIINAAKNYYSTNNSLPTAKGECQNVTYQTLYEQNLLTNEEIINSCDTLNSYIKVCMLPNNEYQYSIITNCGNEKYQAHYNEFTTQTTEIIPENADVEFSFLLQEKIEPESLSNIKEEKIWEDKITYEEGTYTILKTTPMYRYKDKLWKWEYTQNLFYPNNKNDKTRVTTYYLTSPEKDYINKTDEQTAYKWYVNTHKKSEQPLSTAQGEYTIKGEMAEPIITFAITKPSDETYRKIENITLYRTRTAITNGDETTYDEWSSWTDKVCEDENNNNTCESQSGYKITDNVWYWYTPTKKIYYPSGSTNKDDENTYYINSPVANALKDESTIETVYKWYKITTKTYDYSTKSPIEGAVKLEKTEKWSDWSDYSANIASASNTRQVEKRNLITLKKNPENTTEEITYKDLTNYTTKEEVIKKAQEVDKKIASLKDIEENSKLNLVIIVNYRTLKTN